ncbi:MAG: hypothetical protein OXH38_04035 [Chloroflexi bacterium]|nr:hypothetical protein [Chloroflexota bacterium]
MAVQTTQTDTTEPLSLVEAADALSVNHDALLEEIRSAAAAAERPSARD